jgi:hypothetical protein
LENQGKNSFANLFLGVMVGVYGGWLISFFDRLTFPTAINFNFYVLFVLAIAAFLTFAAYFISAFTGGYGSNLFWVFHVVITLTCFIFQDSFIKHNQSILGQNIVFWVLGFLILCVILPWEWVSSGRRKRHVIEARWRKPKIAILNDMKWDLTNTQISTWTDVPPEEWKNLLKSAADFTVELTTTRSPLDKYVAILNPYGGVYPEFDLKNFSAIKEILNFVREGGIFINVADVPSYWAYDQKLKRRLDATAPIYQIQNNQVRPLRLFELTPLMKELGLSVFNITNPPLQQNFGAYSSVNANIVSERVAVLEKNMRSLIPTNRLGNTDTSAFFVVAYGEGDFIFSLIWLNHSLHSSQSKQLLKNAIIKETIDNIRLKVNLHKKPWYKLA